MEKFDIVRTCLGEIGQVVRDCLNLPNCIVVCMEDGCQKHFHISELELITLVGPNEFK